MRKNFLISHVFNNQDFLQAVARLTRSADNYDISHKLDKITARTLIIAADTDPLTPYADQKALAEGIKGAELILLPNCGHASMYEKPTLFASLITGFINTDFTGLE